MHEQLARPVLGATYPIRSPGRYRWCVAGLIFLIYTIAAADRANIGFALPFIRKEFEMSNTQAGALVSLFLFAYALAQIPSGIAASKFGVRKLFSISMILTSLFTGLIGTTSSILTLKVYRFALGLAEGPLPVGITSTINNWFPPHEKGTASGIFLSAVKFGPVLVPPVCAVIVAHWGWREIFYVFSIPGFVLAVVWYIFVTNHPSESKYCSPEELAYIEGTGAASEPVHAAAPAPSMQALDRLIRSHQVELLETRAAVFRSWNIMGCALGYCFQLGISNVLLAWIPTYLLTVKKFSVMNMGYVAAAPWVGAVVGNIVGGLLSDRLLDKRRKPGMMLSALATAGMMYLLISAPADPLRYGALLFATGVMLSLGYSAYMAYRMSITSKKAFPIASSLINTGGQLGGAIAPLATGMLLDSYGWDYVFIFMSVGSLMTLLLLCTIAEPRQRDR